MTLWYVARVAGLVALIMFTLAATLGIITSGSRHPERRFWLQYVHRSAAVTGLVLLGAHILAVIADSNVAISPTVLVWPFGSEYRPFAVALGVLAMYSLVLATVAGAARGRLARFAAYSRYWRTIHIAASAGWAVSVGHALLAGTDRSTPWMLAITLSCLAAVVGAAMYRAHTYRPPTLVRAGRTT